MYSNTRLLDSGASSPTPPKSTVSLTLTPQQLPLAPSGTAPKWKRQRPPELLGEHPEVSPCLRICPGEPSQLSVQIHNHHRQNWQIRLAVSSNFPQPWCRVPEASVELLGQVSADDEERTTEVDLSFQVPADFFENQHALRPSHQPLKLDYDGQVQVYARPTNAPTETEKLLATAPFRVMVRSHSRYLDYLPQVYQEVDFIGRLLKLFEQSFDPSVEALQQMWAYLDPRTTSAQLLPFLAHWVGWLTDFPWDSASPIQQKRQRRLVFNAMELYSWRGTGQGLRRYLHLYTGLPETTDHIHIENAFKPGFEIGNARLEETTIIGGGRPYHFVVTLSANEPQVSHQSLLDKEEIIHTIICQEKPAFCTYRLHIHSPYSSTTSP